MNNFVRTQYPQEAFFDHGGTQVHHPKTHEEAYPDSHLYSAGGVAHYPSTLYIESGSAASRVTTGESTGNGQIHYAGHPLDFAEPSYAYTGSAHPQYSGQSLPIRRSWNIFRMFADFSQKSMQGAGTLVEQGKSLLGAPGGVQDVAAWGVAVAISPPKPMSLGCMCGGASLSLVCALGLFNIFSLLTSPSVYLTQVFLLMFGIATVVAEASPGTLYLGSIQPFLLEWVKFLALLSGRGIFYLFVGLTAVSLWPTCFAVTIAGLVYLVMGTTCLALHIRARQVQRGAVAPDTSRGSSRMTTHAGCDDEYPDDDVNYTDRSGGV